MRDFIKVWRNVIAYINWSLTIATTKLGYVRYRRRIERPKSILVKGFDPFRQSDLDAICKKIVLAKEVLLLNPIKKVFLVYLPDRHGQPSARKRTLCDDARTESLVMPSAPIALP